MFSLVQMRVAQSVWWEKSCLQWYLLFVLFWIMAVAQYVLTWRDMLMGCLASGKHYLKFLKVLFCASEKARSSVSGLLRWCHIVCLTVQTVLSEGGVPQRPVVFVSRPELVNRIREKLYRLQKQPGWVTVFGMAGCGKSVLAAEAVRHHCLIEGK